MTRALTTTILFLCAATAGAQADHLQCFKIRDSVTKTTYTATLAPTDNAFPVATGCIVKVPPKLLCVDVVKTITAGTPPGAGPGAPAQKYLCYKVKCPKTAPTATIQDQFGTHQVTAKGTSLLCAPEPAPTTSTTTTSTSSTTTSTGCTMSNQCPPAPNAIPSCQAGMCTFICNLGFANCDANPNDGCEVNTQNDTSNCGMCGHICSFPNAAPICSGGTCSIGMCLAPYKDCNGMSADGCEVNSATDPNNCGLCGTVCAPVANGTRACNSGACQIGSCNTGFADCDGQYNDGCEINLTNNPNNCGGCGAVCPMVAPNCVNSACTP